MIERAKGIITEKIKILKKDLNKQFLTTMANKKNTGNLNENYLFDHENDTINDEKENIITPKTLSFPKNEKESTLTNTIKSSKSSLNSNTSKNLYSNTISPSNSIILRKIKSETYEDENFNIENQLVDINSEVEPQTIK